MRDRWKDCSDEELIIRLREGEQEVMDYLMDKYKNLVRDKAKSMYILGGDTEDLIQEGMIGLFKAVRDYDFGRDAGFSTFATLCISRQMYTAVQASGRKKHMPLNTYISLSGETTHTDEQKENVSLENVLQSGQLSDPEKMLIDRENISKKQQRESKKSGGRNEKSTKIVKEESCDRAGIGDDRFQYDDRSGIVAGPCGRSIGADRDFKCRRAEKNRQRQGLSDGRGLCAYR